MFLQQNYAFSQCNNPKCEKSFKTLLGLQFHQGRKNNYECYRAGIWKKRQLFFAKINQKKEHLKNSKIPEVHRNLSKPNPKGKSFSSQSKQLIVNCYQTLRSRNHSKIVAIYETSTLLKVGEKSVKNIINEALPGTPLISNHPEHKKTYNAFEKLSEVQKNDIREIVHQEIKKILNKEAGDGQVLEPLFYKHFFLHVFFP